MEFTVTENSALTRDVYRMALTGDVSAVTAPGQFVQVRLPGFYLRRPISVCGRSAEGLVLVYKAVGAGTEEMTRLRPGAALEVLTGLGNGYDLSLSGDEPLLVGGGVGAPPLLWLCRALLAQGKRPTVVLGFNTAADVFLVQDFERLGARVLVTTADGSAGLRGFVTAAMEGLRYTHVYACGPKPMLRAVCEASGDVDGQFSLEERMGCGFGACMGCTVETAHGPKRVCKDGPVFRKEEIVW